MEYAESQGAPRSRSRLGMALMVVLALAGAWALVKHFAGASAASAGYDWDFAVLWKYRSLLISGLLYTLLFTVVCVVLGLLVGVVTGLGRLSIWVVSGNLVSVWVCASPSCQRLSVSVSLPKPQIGKSEIRKTLSFRR
jgi:hypothetical protein